MYQEAAFWVAQVELQQGLVIGYPALHFGVNAFRRCICTTLQALLVDVVKIVIHQHEHGVLTLLLPEVQQVHGLRVQPGPQGLFHIAQHQVQHQALPHGGCFHAFNVCGHLPFMPLQAVGFE